MALAEIEKFMASLPVHVRSPRSIVTSPSLNVASADWTKSKEGYAGLTLNPRNGIPSDDFTTRPAMIEWDGPALKEPVWVDLFTGAVYAFPLKQQVRHSRGISFIRVPVYDSPCVLTERRAVMK